MQNLRFIPSMLYMNSGRESGREMGELTQTWREMREMPPITGDRCILSMLQSPWPLATCLLEDTGRSLDSLTAEIFSV